MYVMPPGKGRRPAPIFYGEPRELTDVDIANMWSTGDARKGMPRLKALRYNHHMLAKAVASGKSLMECSQLVGLRPAVISDLKNDPAFQELVAFYAEELHQVYVDVHARMAAFGTSVLEELQERFEKEPDKFTKRELMDLFSTMADRSIPTAKGGPSPQQGISIGSGGGGLALQINFVSPTVGEPETIEAKIEKDVVNAISPPNLPSDLSIPLDLSAIPSDNSPNPAPLPSAPLTLPFEPSAVELAKMAAAEAAAEKREREKAERDAIRAEYLAKRKK